MLDNETPEATAGQAPAPAQAQRPTWDDTPQVDPGREKLVKQWIAKVVRAEKKWKKTFDRMKECRQLAREGAPKEWLNANSYTVPIIPRHINGMVSALYAKDPRAVATPRKKLLYTIWDGTPESLHMAMQSVAAAMAPSPAPTGAAATAPGAGPAPMGHNGGPAMEPDPAAVALVNEVQQVRAYEQMIKKLGKSLELCWQYFTEEQRTNFKSQMKALVRRTKINGVGYVKLGYQRALGKNPEITAGIQDVTDKIAAIEAGLKQMADGGEGYEEGSAKLAELMLSKADLESQETIIVREGPIFDFPRSDEIIVDDKVRHLKSFAGADWIAHKFDKTPEEVLETWKVDVKNTFTRHYAREQAAGAREDDKTAMCRVYEIQDRKTQMTFVVCDGYPDFLKEPAIPDVKIDRFWTVFPLVFNEVESDDGEVYPPSDVWLMRHPQAEYNRARQGLREHRTANRPKYVYPSGRLEEEDKEKLTNSPANALIGINGMTAGEKIGDVIQRVDMVGIDPNQYQVEEHFKDTLRAVGSQEANLGTAGGATATETSVAEQGRQTGIADQTDELDDFLSELVKATGQLMLLELASDTVKEIAGPGASWPDHPMTRDEISKDLLLDIRAGSSGRPNQAAEIAKIERAAPYLLQLPGVNPEPLVARYADLLDIDMDELYTAGVPSITAMNAMANKAAAAQPGTGNPANNPADQGAKGEQNQKNPRDNEPPAQPAYPAPGDGQTQVA